MANAISVPLQGFRAGKALLNVDLRQENIYSDSFNIHHHNIFYRIFALAPEAHGLFRFTNGFEPNSEELFESERLIEHGKGVIATLEAAIDMLGPASDLNPLICFLQELGANHQRYGVLHDHYPIVGKALIETLSAAMGDKFTDDIKLAWEEIYGIIESNMIDGMEKAS